MSDNWIVGNLQNSIGTWNEKLGEIWQLVSQTPENFKGGGIWNVIVNIHGAIQAIRNCFTCNILFSRSYKNLHIICRNKKARTRIQAIFEVWISIYNSCLRIRFNACNIQNCARNNNYYYEFSRFWK